MGSTNLLERDPRAATSRTGRPWSDPRFGIFFLVLVRSEISIFVGPVSSKIQNFMDILVWSALIYRVKFLKFSSRSGPRFLNFAGPWIPGPNWSRDAQTIENGANCLEANSSNLRSEYFFKVDIYSCFVFTRLDPI